MTVSWASLAATENAQARRQIAGSTRCPPFLLTALASDPVSYVRGAVAANPAAPLELLDRLARDGDDFVRSGVASNPITPIETLRFLLASGDSSVVCRLGSRRGLPTDVLDALVHHPDPYVRVEAAQNPDVNAEQLRSIFEKHEAEADDDSRPELDWYLLDNPRTPTDILEQISGQTWPQRVGVPVIDELLQAVTTGEPTSDWGYDRARAFTFMMRDPSLPSELLAACAELASRGYASFRPAYEFSAPDELCGWATNLARNPSTPSEALLTLASTRDPVVATAAAGNPAATTEVLQVAHMTLRAPRKTGSWFEGNLEYELARNPRTPADILRQLIQAATKLSAHALDLNPAVPDDVMLQVWSRVCADEPPEFVFGA